MATNFGFRAINSTNIIQVDQDFRNLCRVAQGTGTVNQGLTINFSNQTSCVPLVYIRPANDSTYIGLNYINSSSFSVQGFGSFDYIVFGLDGVNTLDSSNFGLKIWDSNGAVVYDSRYENPKIKVTLRVNQVFPDYRYSGNSSQTPAYPYTLSFTSWGTRPWFCLNQLWNFNDDDGNCLCATTIGTSGIRLQCGVASGNKNWVFATNNGSNGNIARSFPGGQFRLNLIEKA